MNLNIPRLVEGVTVTELITDRWKGILNLSRLMRSLSNAEVNDIQERVRYKLTSTLGVELR